MKEYKQKVRGYKPLLLRDTLRAKDPEFAERGIKTSMAERIVLNRDTKKAREMISSGPVTCRSTTAINVKGGKKAKLKAIWTIQRCIKKFIMKKNVKTMTKELSRKLDIDFEQKGCSKTSSVSKLSRYSGLTETNDRSDQNISCGNTVRDFYYTGNGKNSILGLSKPKKNFFTAKVLTAVWNN